MDTEMRTTVTDKSAVNAEELFRLDDDPACRLLSAGEPAWRALDRLSDWVAEQAEAYGVVVEREGVYSEGLVVLGRDVVIEPGAFLRGPLWIGDGAAIRHGAYLRGEVVVGAGAVVGHCTEIKHSLLLPGAAAPHFNYVGDSVLGRDVNLGAGTVLSNLKLDRRPIRVRVGQLSLDTGRTKLGAILGDGCQTGCNTVLNPGTVAGPGCLFYPQANAAGYFPPGAVVTSAVQLHRAKEAGHE